MTVRGVVILALLVALGSALELVFGVNDTGATVALVLLCWSSLAVPASLVFGKLMHDLREGFERDDH